MRYVIDRFEGDFAVCETPEGTMVNVARALLPADAKEGRAVLSDGERWVCDPDTSASERIRSKMDRLWKN